MRIFLGTVSIAGVLWNYRMGLRGLGVDARVIVDSEHRFGYSYDEIISESGPSHQKINLLMSLHARVKKLPRFIRDFDIFHFYSRSLMPRALDVPIIKLSGKKIVMSFLGSDIRCSTPVLEGIEDRGKCNYCKHPCRISRKKKNVSFWARNADAIMSGVDNSQILDYYSIPYFVITLPCDVEYWKPFDSKFHKSKEDDIVIVHAPSSPRLKGTNLIINSINELKKEGYKITFKLLHNVPNNVVRNWLNVADIVIDRAHGRGWYGMLAVESMALAKPTISYIYDEYKKKVKYGEDLPIINIMNENLIQTLAHLIENPKLREKIGKKSRKYVENVHDSKIVCMNLLKIYQDIFS